MYRFLKFILLATLLCTFTTLAGMTFFGTGHTDIHMDASCLEHCLSDAASINTAVTPNLILPLLLFVAVSTWLLYVWRPTINPAKIVRFQRWRESIGRQLLHQKLSSVILLS